MLAIEAISSSKNGSKVLAVEPTRMLNKLKIVVGKITINIG